MLERKIECENCGETYPPGWPHQCESSASPACSAAAIERDAARYRWLRERDLDTIHLGGVFAGQTPENLVINGEDLDRAIDEAMSR